VAIAQELLKAFGSLDGVFAASAGALAAVKVGKQSFGKVKAERLHGLMHSALPLTKTTDQTEPSSSNVEPAAEPAEHTTECD
jgi:DNA repair protein RadC